MKINIISTGSSGNLYELLDSEGNSIILEAGEPRNKYLKQKIGALPPEMCIVSHGHMDHSHYIGEYRAIVPTYLSQEENVSEHFKAFGFTVKHGEGTSTAYIIKSLVENDFLFFGTDFEYADYVDLFENLHYYKVDKFLIECNYNQYLYHLANEEQRRGCIRHLSDTQLVRFVKRTGAKNPKIITIHGSHRLSADIYTKKYIQKAIPTATVSVAVGSTPAFKNIFSI
jgi:ribonuclease BN (tRNA processing enzyme)